MRNREKLSYVITGSAIVATREIVSFEPVFDSDAACFVGVSALRSMLSEGKRGRKVLVTGGT